MSTTNDGGPAFPVNGPNGDHPGMSLRDYFSAKAMQGILADHEVTSQWPVIAKCAYAMADAMLAAREAK